MAKSGAKRVVRSGIFVVASCWGSANAQAQSWDISGEAAIRSRFVDDDLFVYSEGPVVQPSVTVEHRPSGCFFSVWASVGLLDPTGDEIDYSLGCERQVADALRVSAYASYYDFIGADDGMFAVSAEASVGNARVEAHYYRPVDKSEADGVRLLGAYSFELSSRTTFEPRVVYDSGPYTDVPSILSAGAVLERSVTDQLAISLTALIPAVRQAGDDRRPQLIAAAVFRF